MTASAGAHSRDRDATEHRILDAVGRVLSSRGFGEIGINTVAREAGIDKVLIYRYFGGLPELLAAFARRSEFWPDEEELLQGAPPRGDRPDVAAAALKGLLRGLRSRPMTQEVLRWELSASNELTGRLAAVREEQGVRTLRKLGIDGATAGADLPAVAALLSAGITYLVLRSTSGQSWLGVSLASARGWKRIERAIELIVRRVLEPRAAARGSKRPTHRAHPRRRKP